MSTSHVITTYPYCLKNSISKFQNPFALIEINFGKVNPTNGYMCCQFVDRPKHQVGRPKNWIPTDTDFWIYLTMKPLNRTNEEQKALRGAYVANW